MHEMNAGLTQVLADSENTYTYSLNRINQVSETQTGYFLTDALGSVRQVVSEENEILLTREYSPRELCAPREALCKSERFLRVGYGETVSSIGDFETDFTYTPYCVWGQAGEMTDGTGLVNLRARYYDSGTGRFVSKDTWSGDYDNPITLVKWVCGNANPVNWWLWICYPRCKLTEYYAKASASATSKHRTDAASCSVFCFAINQAP